MLTSNTKIMIASFKGAIQLIEAQPSVLKSDDYKSLLYFLQYMLEQLERIDLAKPYLYYSDVHSACRSFFEVFAYFCFIIEDQNEMSNRLRAYRLSGKKLRTQKLLANLSNQPIGKAPKMQNGAVKIAQAISNDHRQLLQDQLNKIDIEISTVFKPIITTGKNNQTKKKKNHGKIFYSLDGGRNALLNLRDLSVHLNLDYIYALIMHEESTEVHGTDLFNSFIISAEGKISRNTKNESDFQEHFVVTYLYSAIFRMTSLKNISCNKELKKVLMPVKIAVSTWSKF